MLDRTLVLVSRNGFGTTAPSDEAFGTAMLEKFLHTLEARGDRPAAICFVTEGIAAVTTDGPALLSLQMLEQMGVRMVACGTCLDHYGRRDDLKVGEAGGMNDIVDLMAGADKVITI